VENITTLFQSIAAMRALIKLYLKGIYIMEKVIFIILNYRHFCTKAFHDRLLQEILFIAPAVPPGVLFTLPELCGVEFWDPLSKWKKTLAGMCMDYFVRNELVPFEYVPRKGRNPYPLQYRIKDSYKPDL